MTFIVKMELENDYRIYELRDQKYWGPKFWNFLYLSVLGFPTTLTPRHKSAFADMLKSLYVFLPCLECRFHCYQMLQNDSSEIETREAAFMKIMDLHNKCRQRLKQNKLSREEVIAYFHRDKMYDFWLPYALPASIIIVLVSFFLLKQTRT